MLGISFAFVLFLSQAKISQEKCKRRKTVEGHKVIKFGTYQCYDPAPDLPTVASRILQALQEVRRYCCVPSRSQEYLESHRVCSYEDWIVALEE